MREIKFRAWQEDAVEKDLRFWTWKEMLDHDLNAMVNSPKYKIMQYTGLKDNNGTEIYEGDILTDHGDGGPLYVEYSNEHAAFVFVDKFDPFGTTSYTTLQISYEQFEIIGNIYEHPHLLGD